MDNHKKISGNRLVDQLDTYQSANSDSQAIKNNFIVRVDEFRLIIDDLRNKKSKDPLQHELILGRRGSGKSTLLKRIQIEIEEDPALSKKYIAINLAEEQAGIYRLFDLWLEVLKEAGNKLQITFSLKEYDAFNNDQNYTRYLYEEINKALKAKKKKIVLLLDNLDRIIENFDDDGNLLREMLHNYNDIQIIGGSTRMDEHFWRYDKPFYEFFRRHRLGPLSSEEIHLLLFHWSQLMDLPQLAAFTKNNPGKIEAVRILTDGLPRTLQFFIDLLLQDSTLYGFDYIRKVMDKVTPLYQERLNNLPAPQRKIVLEAAFIWEACTAKQLVQKCNMESKLISAHLKQLSNIGIIETLSTSKKNHLYRLSERFFNMWLIVTQGNPEQKRKAKWLTIFIETWYNTAHLKTLVTNHIANLQEQKVPYERALILTKAFSQSKYTSMKERDEMLEYTNKLKTSTARNSFLELPKKYSDIANEIEKLIGEGKITEAHKMTDELENENDGVKFFIKGYLFDEESNVKKAENYYLQAIEKGHINALYNLAILYADEGRNEEAENYYLQAIEKKHINALFNLALLYYENNKHKKNALLLINKYMEQVSDPMEIDFLIIIEVWNATFINLEERVWQVINDSNYENLNWFFTNLLIQEQAQIVSNVFANETHGKILQDKYSLLYYALLLLTNKHSIDNPELRIPPEVMPTVLEIKEDIEQKQAMYANGKY
jgi:TPR repeat protein